MLGDALSRDGILQEREEDDRVKVSRYGRVHHWTEGRVLGHRHKEDQHSLSVRWLPSSRKCLMPFLQQTTSIILDSCDTSFLSVNMSVIQKQLFQNKS